jgi:hypothetical protein
METSWLAGVTEACRSEKQTELRRVLGLPEELGQAARPRGADWVYIAAALQAAGATAGVVDRANQRGQEADGRGHGAIGGMGVGVGAEIARADALWGWLREIRAVRDRATEVQEQRKRTWLQSRRWVGWEGRR